MAKPKAAGRHATKNSRKKTASAVRGTKRSRPAVRTKKAAARKPARKLTAKKKTAGRAASKKARPAKRNAKTLRRVATKTAKRPATALPRRASSRRPAAATAPRAAQSTAPRAAKLPDARLARLNRMRRTLEETVPTPPSSLDMNRDASAARSGRIEMEEMAADQAGMSPAIKGGDVDVNLEDAYFTGDEAPGGDNPTPDQDIVDNIGKALGVQYQDSEELRASDKVTARDKHRWELDPASAEDYRDRKN